MRVQGDTHLDKDNTTIIIIKRFSGNNIHFSFHKRFAFCSLLSFGGQQGGGLNIEWEERVDDREMECKYCFIFLPPSHNDDRHSESQRVDSKRIVVCRW